MGRDQENSAITSSQESHSSNNTAQTSSANNQHGKIGLLLADFRFSRWGGKQFSGAVTRDWGEVIFID